MESLTKLNRRNFSRQSVRRGTALVEMAIVLPILLLFFLAAFEFSRVAMIRPTVDTAVYDAARRAIVPGAKARDAEKEARRTLATIGLREADIQITPFGRDTPSVTVTIEVPIERNSIVPIRFFKGKTVRRTLTLRREGIEI